MPQPPLGPHRSHTRSARRFARSGEKRNGRRWAVHRERKNKAGWRGLRKQCTPNECSARHPSRKERVARWALPDCNAPAAFMRFPLTDPQQRRYRRIACAGRGQPRKAYSKARLSGVALGGEGGHDICLGSSPLPRRLEKPPLINTGKHGQGSQPSVKADPLSIRTCSPYLFSWLEGGKEERRIAFDMLRLSRMFDSPVIGKNEEPRTTSRRRHSCLNFYLGFGLVLLASLMQNFSRLYMTSQRIHHHHHHY